MSGLVAYTPDPPFFTTDINNEFLSRFKNPQVRAQVQVPAIEEYEVLTLFEFWKNSITEQLVRPVALVKTIIIKVLRLKIGVK